eukprot:2223878-Pyramimonas_sp.AAC.1
MLRRMGPQQERDRHAAAGATPSSHRLRRLRARPRGEEGGPNQEAVGGHRGPLRIRRVADEVLRQIASPRRGSRQGREEQR